MTIDIGDLENQIILKEFYDNGLFIGYISPDGKVIDFNKPLGESSHEGWNNIVSDAFLSFISYVVRGTSIKKLEGENFSEEFIRDIKYTDSDEYAFRGVWPVWGLRVYSNDYDRVIKELDEKLKYNQFCYDEKKLEFCHQIYVFFKNAYTNKSVKSFFETIDRKIYVTSKDDFFKSNNCLKSFNYNFKINSYMNHLKIELMQHFKDIAVMYLGYDSIERFNPNGKLIENAYHKKYSDDPLRYFAQNPRIITTSYSNVNERFYNLLLMNWDVHKLPKYRWNEQVLKYEKEPFYLNFYEIEKEKILGEEIKSIKRLVPIENRHKYFR